MRSTQPGEAAEVDFGVLGLWVDPLLGRPRRVYGLLVTLCFSRYAFLAITLRQDLAAVLDGLESAWVFFGGVVKRLVEDNLKPVVTRADRYVPGIDRVFLEYAQLQDEIDADRRVTWTRLLVDVLAHFCDDQGGEGIRCGSTRARRPICHLHLDKL